jgi:hypothetical protein
MTAQDTTAVNQLHGNLHDLAPTSGEWLETLLCWIRIC